MTPRRCERSSEPLSRVSTWARSSIRASIPSATFSRMAERSATGSAAQAGNAALAAATAASTSAWPPRLTSAMTVPSSGETSSNVVALATRSPPIQCRVSISTPATTALVMERASARMGGGRASRSGLSFGHKRMARLRRRQEMSRTPIVAIPARFSSSASAHRHRAISNARALSEAVLLAGGEPVTDPPVGAGRRGQHRRRRAQAVVRGRRAAPGRRRPRAVDVRAGDPERRRVRRRPRAGRVRPRGGAVGGEFRHAAARDLPRVASGERRSRRRARAAHGRAAPARGARGGCRRGQRARGRRRPDRCGVLLPPPARQPAGRRPRARGARCRRHDRGRGAGRREGLVPRRPVAPRGHVRAPTPRSSRSSAPWSTPPADHA